jgi:hypothetical protein
MVHEVRYDATNEVAVLEFKNHFLYSDVDPIFTKANEILAGKPYRQVVVIMSPAHDVENRETREATAAYLSKLSISEIAFVGGSAANRMVARVLIKTGILKINGDFFKEYENAIEWLKSKR